MNRKNPQPELNQTFGSWTIINTTPVVKGPHRYWDCRCACGTIRAVREQSLIKGSSLSCGCATPLINNLGKFGTGEALKGKPRPWTQEWKDKMQEERSRVRDTKNAQTLALINPADRTQVCAECGAKVVHLWQHVRVKHLITSQEYYARHPGAQIVSSYTMQKIKGATK